MLAHAGLMLNQKYCKQDSHLFVISEANPTKSRHRRMPTAKPIVGSKSSDWSQIQFVFGSFHILVDRDQILERCRFKLRLRLVSSMPELKLAAIHTRRSHLTRRLLEMTAAIRISLRCDLEHRLERHLQYLILSTNMWEEP